MASEVGLVPTSSSEPRCPTTMQSSTPKSSISSSTPRTITELISLRAREYPQEPILGYPTDNLDSLEYTYHDLEKISSLAARSYARSLPIRNSSTEEARVIALLGPSDLDYFWTILALAKLGFTILFLSTRLSEPAYLSLLEGTNCQHIVVGASFRKTAKTLAAIRHGLQVVDMIPRHQYSTEEAHEIVQSSQDFDLEAESSKVAWIIHSSGSTGPPKTNYLTHKMALNRGLQNKSPLRAFNTLPLYHAFGLSSIFRGIAMIKKIYMYNASLPMTSRNLVKILNDHRFEMLLAVPYTLKLLSETQEGIDALASLKEVICGGSACPEGLGDLLTAGGVSLIVQYGISEAGQLMTSARPEGDKVWNYLREHDGMKPYVRFEPVGENLFELCILDGWPAKVATNRDDGSFATKDLFEPHPSIPGAWKYSGRLDDTIVLTNGEKTIPLAMEQAVNQHRLVREAVMFGSGRSQVGMIIIKSESAGDMSAEELADILWPTIEAENKSLAQHAQLSRVMVKVLLADTVYPLTDKGSLMRRAFYTSFQAEIEELYREVESGAGGTLELSDSELRGFLHEQVLQIFPHEDESVLTVDTDLFSLGVDSLQSTRLRAKILKEIQLNGNILPQNVVFDHPTIAKLATAILNIRDRKSIETKDVIMEMQELVVKYSAFPQHVPAKRTSQSNCVVLTGASGSLGAHLLAQLVVRKDITEVCCPVRAETLSSARDRVIKSLEDRAIYHDLPVEARRKITCYPSDFSKEDLGLDDDVYDLLADKITTLIHCAWSVNFNKSLSSFEADCISGTRNLMLLCLAAKAPTPASFNFCSSVSTVLNTPGETVEETLPQTFECASRIGYAQSKLVAEHLVLQAAAATGMKTRVLRVGQIIADTKHGIWNDSEAVPLTLQSATTFGALPALDEYNRWLPVDNAATIVLDIALSDTTESVFNIVNPRTFHWTRELLPTLRLAGLSFEEVNQREWIRRLRAADPNPVVNPTIKLVDFFTRQYDNDREQRRNLSYMASKTAELSPTLRNVPALSEDLVKRFVGHFLKTSWAPKSDGTNG